ncbi:hypothetical protein ACLKA6_000539 [Drosophila palustris]
MAPQMTPFSLLDKMATTMTTTLASKPEIRWLCRTLLLCACIGAAASREPGFEPQISRSTCRPPNTYATP